MMSLMCLKGVILAEFVLSLFFVLFAQVSLLYVIVVLCSIIYINTPELRIK